MTLIKKYQHWISGCFVFLTLLLGFTLLQKEPHAPITSTADIDTFIPAGYVLVPITVHNSESLDSVFGSFGVVDLYPVGQGEKKSSEALVRSVKMLRAPKNPSQFGVLVKDALVERLVQHDQGFFVVLHHPKKSGTTFELAKKQKPMRIRFEEDEK
jgi:hypothetical protein